jgi:hypothetical protein
LALAAGALIATSAPPPPASRLDATLRASPELTASVPTVSGRLTLNLSAAALPAPANDRVRVNGTVTIRASSTGYRMDVRPLGVVLPGPTAGPTIAPESSLRPVSDGTTTWAIEDLCRVAEPCLRDFEVTLSLINPQSGQNVVADFDATVEIVYHEIDANPDGANASWSASAELAPIASPSVTGS